MNAEALTVDVLIPARGDCLWLEAALESVARQTRPPDSVILVDDGLSDPQACDESGERLLGALYRRIPNRGRGISAALNTGVACSEADWVARMDADDVCHPRRLETQCRHLAEVSEEVLGCGGQVRMVDAAGRGLTVSTYPTDPAAIEQSLLVRSCFAHPAMMLRRSALLATPYRPALDGAEDVDLFLRLSECGRLQNLDMVLLDYRVYVGQQNFQGRARQTALQELAFRLARLRRAGAADPLDSEPAIAADFTAWRLAMPGYRPARQALTALRYLAYFLRGRNLSATAACLCEMIAAMPWRPSVLRWMRRVQRQGPGGLALDETPIVALGTVPVAGDDEHA